MDTLCDFPQAYEPMEDSTEDVALTHVRNCPVCQDEVHVLSE